MNKNYIYIAMLLIVFAAGFAIGKYNNSQRYLFHNESRIILDTYTGSVHLPSGTVIKLNKKIKTSSKDRSAEEANVQ